MENIYVYVYQIADSNINGWKFKHFLLKIKFKYYFIVLLLKIMWSQFFYLCYHFITISQKYFVLKMHGELKLKYANYSVSK